VDPSIVNPIVVVKPDQLAELQVTGERARLVRDPSMRSPSDARKRVVIDDRMPGAIESARACASAIAMPTAFPIPWPSGPVVARRRA